jgi:probable blue pigment (indigoidine) exporter
MRLPLPSARLPSALWITLTTAVAPVLWGCTYLVTTELLPPGYPITVSMLRALPAGLLLLLLVRRLPAGRWWWRSLVLGATNITLFWICLFVGAYRLPGGVAATVGAVQPLLVLGLSALVLRSRVPAGAVAGALLGVGGVALLVLTPGARLDALGVGATLLGAASMALGVVLTRRWGAGLPLLTLTAWQLTAGGLLLVPLAVALEPALPPPTVGSVGGILFLALPGAVLSYILWFRGIAQLGPPRVTLLGLLSPLTAVLLGWAVRGEALEPPQALGALLVLSSIVLGRSPAPRRALTLQETP